MRRKTLTPLIFIMLVAVVGLAGTLAAGNSPELGLDLQGGVSVVLEPTGKASGDALDQSVAIIRDRVDALGVAEPDITRQGNAVIVQLPGVENRDRALDLVGQTAELRFRPVVGFPTGAEQEGQPPADPELTPRDDDTADDTVVLADKEGRAYELGPTLATGRVVADAQAQIPQGAWTVSLEMRGGEDGIDRFNEIAAECFSRTATCPSGQLAIVLDSVVQSAPEIQQPSFRRDQIQITGQFSEADAKDLALVLRYGSLPVELERQSVQTVSASLGEDSLRAGLIAGAVGLVLVAIYMVLYYRALGVVVIVGFGVWGSLMYSLVSWLGQTQGLALTLAGVTGLIMSIGLTADSYVVFFERLKDEIGAGRTLRSSTERAFKRAFRTILAANMSSFIGAAVLWWLTVGSVRGFALFLGLSTALGVVVTWFFTRPVVTLLSRSRVFTEMPVLGVARGLTGRQGAPEVRAAATVGSGR